MTRKEMRGQLEYNIELINGVSDCDVRLNKNGNGYSIYVHRPGESGGDCVDCGMTVAEAYHMSKGIHEALTGRFELAKNKRL